MSRPIVLAAGVLLCLLIGFARAHAAAPSPAPRDVCVDGVVSKEKLGFALLDMHGITRAFESSLPPNPKPPFSTMPVWQRVLAEDPLCAPGGACTDEFKKRFKRDLDAAGDAQQHLILLLGGGQEAYRNPSGILEPVAYVTDPKVQLECRAEHPAAPVGQPATTSSFDKLANPLRIRGSTDGLFYSRDMPQFKTVDAAVVGFNNDDIKDTRTDKLTAVIGYAFQFSPAPFTALELIPYVGTNRNVTHTGGKPSSTSAETVDAGFVGAFYAPIDFGVAQGGFVLGNWFTLRPDYLLDLQDDSRLFSFNATYMPSVNRVLNDYIRLIPARDDFLWVRPIFDVRMNGGVYTDRGTGDPAKRQDYARLGTQFGFALSSDIPRLPLDLKVVNTYLHGFTGTFSEINYFKATLTFSLDPKRYFGVNLSYSDGRREDTAQLERLWSVSFSARY